MASQTARNKSGRDPVSGTNFGDLAATPTAFRVGHSLLDSIYTRLDDAEKFMCKSCIKLQTKEDRTAAGPSTPSASSRPNSDIGNQTSTVQHNVWGRTSGWRENEGAEDEEGPRTNETRARTDEEPERTGPTTTKLAARSKWRRSGFWWRCCRGCLRSRH